MKTLRGFLRSLRSNPIYAGDFSKREDVFRNFDIADDNDIVICYANYWDDWGYSGEATVVYYRKSTKKYYEQYGSHCSCFGLEGQWGRDEEMVLEEFENRIAAGKINDGGNTFRDAYQKYKE